jgi:hypothetical protein
MERVTCAGLPDCLRLSNDRIEVVVPTTIGPRIMSCRVPGGPNLLGEYPQLVTNTPLGEWKPWGGHRLWAAPEQMPGSYAPDNAPIQWELRTDRSLLVRQQPDASGLEKSLVIHLPPNGRSLTIEHEICNRHYWPIEIAAWALTIVSPGATALLPQPAFRSHDEQLLPVRAMALWSFTNMTDRRWRFGRRFITLTPDQARGEPQKIGIRNELGWCACVWPEAVLVKQFAFDAAARYPDCGVNNEIYVDGPYLEIETLGGPERLEPGERTRLVERWIVGERLSAAVIADESRLYDACVGLLHDSSG